MNSIRLGRHPGAALYSLEETADGRIPAARSNAATGKLAGTYGQLVVRRSRTNREAQITHSFRQVIERVGLGLGLCIPNR
jgi:hypothetical protein